MALAPGRDGGGPAGDKARLRRGGARFPDGPLPARAGQGGGPRRRRAPRAATPQRRPSDDRPRRKRRRRRAAGGAATASHEPSRFSWRDASYPSDGA